MNNHHTHTPKFHARDDRTPQVFLPIITLLLLGMVGAYWHFFGSPFQFVMPRPMTSLGHEMLPASDSYVNDNFDMGGVQLGMTPDMLRQLHPSAKSASGREGDKVMTLSTKRGMMVAWFSNDAKLVEVDGQIYANESERIYRLRMDEAYASLTEQDLMRMYSRTYGRPLEATCERNQLGDTPRCTYRWWGGEGIELTAILKQKVDANGQPYVLLTTIATNTLKAAKQANVSSHWLNTGTFAWG